MDEVEIGFCEQLPFRVSQRGGPGRVDLLEVTIEAGDAEMRREALRFS